MCERIYQTTLLVNGGHEREYTHQVNNCNPLTAMRKYRRAQSATLTCQITPSAWTKLTLHNPATFTLEFGFKVTTKTADATVLVLARCQVSL